MAELSCDIVVVGAGVLGLCVAVELTARGHDVRVVDPGGPNASSVAAGMIAPAFEALLDEADAERAALLRDAAASWPAFAKRFDIVLDRTPAEWRGGDGAGVAARLDALGFPIERAGDRVRAPSDGRIDPERALQRLVAALAHPAIRGTAGAMAPVDTAWRVETNAGVLTARDVVLATGATRALIGLPEEVAALVEGITPIAGQIGRVSDEAAVGVLRGPDGYVAGGEGGMMIGATMVAGSRDLAPDPAASHRLIEAGGGLLGRAVASSVEWRVGVRGATADGLPMAGPSGAAGLHLALAPRRNGWLLGPLVGRIVADGIEGRPRGLHAAALDPMRFSLPAG